MKWKPLRQIIRMSRYALIGVFLQSLFCSMLIAENSIAQKSIEEIYITLNVEDVSIKQLFKEIEVKTDFEFVYQGKVLKNTDSFSETFRNRSIGDILRHLSAKHRLKFKRVNNKIAVRSSTGKPSRGVEEILNADIQQSRISGKVISDGTDALPGVSIVIKGTNIGTTTDIEGNYSLQVSEGDILQFSYIGYLTQEIPIGSQSVINVNMKPDAEQLEEIVVVGYGTQNRNEVTGAVVSLSGKELGEVSSDAFTRALSGKIAGVQIQQTTGTPGGSISVRIRGTSSIGASNDPLYVIDGFPIENSNISSTDQGFNPLSTINPDDIESIEVLKDASAAAIYGSRGANGVVIITTKRGKAGAPKINFNATLGTQSVVNKVEMMNGPEFLELSRESKLNEIATTNPDGEPLTFIDRPEFQGVDTDWQDEIFRAATVQNYQLSISGGTDNVQYFVSGGYLNEEGIVLSSGIERYSVRTNFNANLAKRLKLGVSLTPTYIVNDEVKAEGHWAGNGVILSALIALPYLPSDASTEDFINSEPEITCCGTPNPIRMANEYQAESNIFRLLSNTYLEYEIIKGLIAKTSIGFDYSAFERNVFDPAVIRRNNNNNGATSRHFTQRSWLSENTLNYSKTIDRHSINALGGFTYQEYQDQNNVINANGLSNTIVTTINEFDKVNGASSFISEWSLVSLLGRVNYSFDDKYFLSASIRQDGSSRFGANNKYAVFPSVSAGWTISEEPFLRDSEILSQLKLRASYGETGNNRIGNYASIPLLTGNRSSYVFGSGNGSSIGGLRTQSIANPDLTWETTKQYDIGLEFGLMKNRVSVVADYFNSRTEDLLLNVPIPASSGFTSSLQNLGRVENKGWEFSVSSKNLVNGFKWDTDFNITFAKNKILELGPEGDPILGGSGRGRIFLNEIGEELSAFWVYKQTGIFQTQQEIDAGATFPGVQTFPGDVKFQDTNGDGIITSDDRVVIGSNAPDFVWGITNNFSYKNFDLNVVVNGVQGSLVHNVQGAFINGLFGIMNQQVNVRDRWRSPTQPGDGKTPRVTRTTTGNNSLAESSRWVEDASFIRIQNVTLGYNAPSSLAKKLHLSSLRLNLSVFNLAYFTKYTGYNPEVSFNGTSAIARGADYGTYPLARRFSMGVKVGF